jgi:hypothetical protein
MTGLAVQQSQPQVSSLTRASVSNPLSPTRTITENTLLVQADLPTGLAQLLGSQTVTVLGNEKQIIRREAPQAESFEERLFDVLVLLKVSVSQYSMHLKRDERHRIFSGLDELLNIDDWHEGDKFPEVASLRAFLKWAIYASFREWASLGISDDGNVLVAWDSDRGRLTANFSASDEVRWTAKIQSDAGVEYAAGKSSLQYFARQARFYLEGA